MQRTGTHDMNRTALARRPGFPPTDAALLGTAMPLFVTADDGTPKVIYGSEGLGAVVSSPDYGSIKLIDLDTSGSQPVLTIEVTPFRSWVNAWIVCPTLRIQVGYTSPDATGAPIGSVRTESGAGIDCTTLEKIVLPADFDPNREVRFVVYDGTLTAEEMQGAEPLMVSSPVTLSNASIYEDPEGSIFDTFTDQSNTISDTARILKWGTIAAALAAGIYFTYPILSDLRESV